MIQKKKKKKKKKKKEQRLEFPHHHCVVLGVVERDVPNLRARL